MVNLISVCRTFSCIHIPCDCWRPNRSTSRSSDCSRSSLRPRSSSFHICCQPLGSNPKSEDTCATPPTLDATGRKIGSVIVGPGKTRSRQWMVRRKKMENAKRSRDRKMKPSDGMKRWKICKLFQRRWWREERLLEERKRGSSKNKRPISPFRRISSVAWAAPPPFPESCSPGKPPPGASRTSSSPPSPSSSPTEPSVWGWKGPDRPPPAASELLFRSSLWCGGGVSGVLNGRKPGFIVVVGESLVAVVASVEVAASCGECWDGAWTGDSRGASSVGQMEQIWDRCWRWFENLNSKNASDYWLAVTGRWWRNGVMTTFTTRILRKSEIAPVKILQF